MYSGNQNQVDYEKLSDEKILQQFRTIVFAVISPPLIYALVLTMLNFTEENFSNNGFVNLSEESFYSIMKYVFWGVGLVSMFVSYKVKNFMIEKAKENRIDRTSFFNSLIKSYIISAAIHEVLPLFGLILCLLAGNMKEMYVIMGISFICGRLFLMPSKKDFE